MYVGDDTWSVEVTGCSHIMGRVCYEVNIARNTIGYMEAYVVVL